MIKKLKILDLNKVIELYQKCFKDNSFFKTDNFHQLCLSFKDIFQLLIKLNYLYAIFQKNQLIAFLLYFDFDNIKYNYPNIFNKIFPQQKLLNLINQYINDKSIFLLSVCVDNEYKGKHLGKILNNKLIQQFHNKYIIFGDCINPIQLNILKRNNFNIINISENYNFFFLNKI